MATTIPVTLTLVSGNDYELTFPSQVSTRQTHVQRANTAAIENTLVDGEIGFQLDTGELVTRFNGAFRKVATQQQGLQWQVFDLATWDMDTTGTLIANLGPVVADITKLVSIDVLIQNDAGSNKSPMGDGGSISMDTSTSDLLVTLTRTGSGVFDDPAYSSTASSRGSVAILTRE